MNKDWSEEIAKDNYKLYRENRESRRPWEIDAIRFDDFRYGQHFSKAEEIELLKYRQAPLPISITTAICDTAESMMVSSKPTIRTAPIINPYNDKETEISRKVARTYNYLIQKSWYDSLGDLQYERVVRDSSNVGHGLFYTIPRMEFGEFKVDIKHIGWRYFYPNAMTKDPFYRDMDNCVIAMRVSQKSAFKHVKAIEPDLTWKEFEEEWVKGNTHATAGVMPSTRYTPSAIKTSGILFIKRIALEDHPAYIIIPRDIEFMGTNTVKFYAELTPEIKALARDGKIEIRNSRRMFLTEYTSYGNKGYKHVYPITKYNITPLVYDHRDTPYPLGRVWYLYPLQRALNKFIMVAILNGSLTNAVRVMSEENSIIDEHEWDKNFAVPGARLKYRLPIPGHSEPPRIIEGKPLAEAWLRMPQYISYIMEYVTGIFGVMMGDSRQSPDVFSTVASLQSAGGLKMKRRLAHADAALSLVGETVAEFYKEYAPINGFASMIDENGEEVPPVKYNVLNPDENDPTKVRMDPTTDLSKGFKSVRFISSPSKGFEAGTEAALLTNLSTQLKLPQLVPLILKRLNIPDTDKLLSQLDSVQKQQATMQEMAKTIDTLDKRTNNLANQLTQKAFELSKAQFDTWFAKQKGELQKQENINNNGVE